MLRTNQRRNAHQSLLPVNANVDIFKVLPSFQNIGTSS